MENAEVNLEWEFRRSREANNSLLRKRVSTVGLGVKFSEVIGRYWFIQMVTLEIE
ncbi:MAG: hypothetical protein ACI8YQ_004108 [Polaribacter sp.]|jgi:hypothetical protein